MKQDVITHKQLLAHSEIKRGELQVHIVQTSEEIKVDTQKHTTYEQELIEETHRLQNEIQLLKSHQAQREREHLLKLEQVQQEHKAKLDTVNKDHHEKVQTINTEHHNKVDSLER